MGQFVQQDRFQLAGRHSGQQVRAASESRDADIRPPAAHRRGRIPAARPGAEAARPPRGRRVAPASPAARRRRRSGASGARPSSRQSSSDAAAGLRRARPAPPTAGGPRAGTACRARGGMRRRRAAARQRDRARAWRACSGQHAEERAGAGDEHRGEREACGGITRRARRGGRAATSERGRDRDAFPQEMEQRPAERPRGGGLIQWVSDVHLDPFSYSSSSWRNSASSLRVVFFGGERAHHQAPRASR